MGGSEQGGDGPERLPRGVYEKELFRLQAELVKLQEWGRQEGTRLVVVFEGRDAAGKGSAIKRVAEYLNPRVTRIVALPAPTERERGEWYFQRYVAQLRAKKVRHAVRIGVVRARSTVRLPAWEAGRFERGSARFLS